MKIGIITDSVRKQSTGIGFYTKDVVQKMLRMDSKNQYFFIDYLENDFNKSRLIYFSYPFRYYKTILWHALLPYRARNIKLDFILNFSANPHFLRYRQREIFFVYDISWYLFPQFHPSSRSVMYKLFFRANLRSCFRIVVDSISTKLDLIKYFSVPEEKISVIYPTLSEISDRRILGRNTTSDPYILFLGTLEPRKNIESIIKAYSKLKRNYKVKHKLVICGKKGWMYENIFKLIESLNLEKDVIYKGYITNDEKKYLFQHAECFVYPSFYEGFGIPLIEAMQLGCPVITSNISSLPEVVGKSGILVNPNDVDQLSNEMYKLIANKKNRLKLVTEGYKQLKKLDNTKQIRSLINLFKI